jgi:hypothetical protein
MPVSVMVKAGQGAPGRGADEEAGKGRQRHGQREPVRAGEREADEHDVAGHVGHEDPAQAEDAHGIDDTGEHRQHEHQRRQRPVHGVRDETTRGGWGRCLVGDPIFTASHHRRSRRRP